MKNISIIISESGLAIPRLYNGNYMRGNYLCMLLAVLREYDGYGSTAYGFRYKNRVHLFLVKK